MTPVMPPVENRKFCVENALNGAVLSGLVTFEAAGDASVADSGSFAQENLQKPAPPASASPQQPDTGSLLVKCTEWLKVNALYVVSAVLVCR